MTGIVTQQIVFEYVNDNPGTNPLQIATALDAPVSAVKARLMTLLYKNMLDRDMKRSRLESMFYYPIGHVRVTRSR